MMFHQFQSSQMLDDDDSPILRRQSKNTAKSSFCLICHAEARIINYGVLSCYSCKTFFRRHCLRVKEIRPCRYGRQCEVTVQTRKCCASCRLTKCLTLGMSSDLMRKEYRRIKPCSMVTASTQEMALPRITPLNLLCNDQSALTAFQWTLLSNVIHAFDRFTLVPTIREIIQYANVDPPNNGLNISDTFNMVASFYQTVQLFISALADFRVLTTAEQLSLFQRNLHGLFNLTGTFMLSDAGMFDHSQNESIIVPLYGKDIVRQAKEINFRLDADATLVKMSHVIFAFSTNCYTVNYDPQMSKDALLRGTFRLLGSQHVYVEILWKYMIYRYGDKQTVLRFAGLVKQMLDLIHLSAVIYTDNLYHQRLVDDLVEVAKTSLILEENLSVPLWGKM